jgi:hypothetical protein
MHSFEFKIKIWTISKLTPTYRSSVPMAISTDRQALMGTIPGGRYHSRLQATRTATSVDSDGTGQTTGAIDPRGQ